MRRAAPLRAASAPALTHSRLPATVRAVLVFSLGLPRSFPLPFAFVSRLASSSSRSLAEPAAPSFLHARYSRSLVDAYRSVSVQCTGCAFPASRSPASPSLCRSAASSFRVSVAQRRCAAAAAVAAAAGSPGRHAPLRAERPALFLRHPRERARSARHCQGHHHRVVVDVVVVASSSSSSSLASSSSSSSTPSFLPSVVDVRFRSSLSRSSSSSCCAVVARISLRSPVHARRYPPPPTLLPVVLT